VDALDESARQREGSKMDNDDRPVGKVLTRREVLTLLGTAGAAFLVACAPESLVPATEGVAQTTDVEDAGFTPAVSGVLPTGTVPMPACVVRPELTEGPYFVDERLNRSDLRSDPSDGSIKDGLPLELAFLVSGVSSQGCVPLADATVDVWHCDAAGLYSDVSDPGFDTEGKRFLRGYQVTDANGMARFTTIYPGWYPGRTVHIHFKIRGTTEAGSRHEFTSQLFFDDDLSDRVFAQPPYSARGERALRNDDDPIFAQGGDMLTLAVEETPGGLTSTFNIGLRL
jgi:protocatechuate 3,4-dioxygenase beta subunit